MRLPRYPVYIISKGRAATQMTAKFLDADGVPFRVVVEPQEADAYARTFVGRDRLIVLPFSNLGLGGYPARNYVWEHAKAEGHRRHWILDDNIGSIRRLYAGERFPSEAGAAFASVEDFTDRYANVAIAGMNYQMFVTPTSPPYRTNVHVYSCLLIDNALDGDAADRYSEPTGIRWRLRYNEDTDLCLQVLDAGHATVLVNVFMVDKKTTMTMAGGNAAELYQGDGRLKMARALEEVWPEYATASRRFGRVQHVVAWEKFATELEPLVGLDALREAGPDEYGLRLRRRGEIGSETLRRIADSYDARWPLPEGMTFRDAKVVTRRPNRAVRETPETTEVHLPEDSTGREADPVPSPPDELIPVQERDSACVEISHGNVIPLSSRKSADTGKDGKDFQGVRYEGERLALMRGLAEELRDGSLTAKNEVMVVHEFVRSLDARIVGESDRPTVYPPTVQESLRGV